MIDYSFSNMDELLKVFDPKVIEKATFSSVNRTTKAAKTYVSRQIKPEYRLAIGRIKKGISIEVNRGQGGLASRVLLFTGRRIGLAHWKTGTATTRKGAKIKGAKRKASDRGRRYQAHYKYSTKAKVKSVTDGFIGQGKTKGSGDDTGVQIFQRIGDDRLGIKKITGPSIAHMVRNDQVMKEARAFIQEEFHKQFKSNMKHFAEQ